MNVVSHSVFVMINIWRMVRATFFLPLSQFMGSRVRCVCVCVFVCVCVAQTFST